MATLLFLLLFAGSAGCVDRDDGENAPTPSTPVYETTLERDHQGRFALVEGNGSAEDWFLLSTPTDEDGTAAAFKWTVPNIAHDDGMMWLEFAPIVPDGVRATGWALLFFDSSGIPIAEILAPTLNVRSWQDALPTVSVRGPDARPFTHGLRAADARPGDELSVVLAASTERPAEFGLGFRGTADPLPAAATTDDFLASVARPILPSRLGVADHFQTAIYQHFTGFGIIGREVWSDSMKVEERLPVGVRPAVTVRDVTMATSFSGHSGWTSSHGWYVATAVGIGDWNVEADARSQRAAGAGVYAHVGVAPAFDLTQQILGFPLWWAFGEGEGSDALRFDLRIAAVNSLEAVSVAQVSLGRPLSDLTEVPAAEDSFVQAGDVPRSPYRRPPIVLGLGPARP